MTRDFGTLTLPLDNNRCPRCGVDKPVATEFGYSSKDRLKVQSYCRPCMAAYHIEWRHGSGQTKYGVMRTEHRARYPERLAARLAVRRAVKSGRLSRGTVCVL